MNAFLFTVAVVVGICSIVVVRDYVHRPIGIMLIVCAVLILCEAFSK